MQTAQKERLEKILIIVGVILVVLELCGVAAWFLWYRSAAEPSRETVMHREETTDPNYWFLEEPTEYTEPVYIPPNLFQPEDFVYSGPYLSCTESEYLLGIDVSQYQSPIDWKQVWNAGISFVMIRVGGRGYGREGSFYIDTMARQHYAGAKAAGLKIGAYFFSQATDVDEAIEEAELALELTKDWELDLPIVYDWEYISQEARTYWVDEWTLTDCTLAFCETIEAAGREAMIYVSPWYGNLRLEYLTEYPQWVALYQDRMTYDYHFDMWQYTCTGSVPGVKGDVDINIMIPWK